MPTPKKRTESQFEDIYYQLRYFGDSCSPLKASTIFGNELHRPLGVAGGGSGLVPI